MPAETTPPPREAGLRIDKWLWYARIVKTRVLATALATGGRMRVNGNRIGKASHPIRAGDVLTFSLHQRVRVLEIRELAERRGPAAIAQALYVDLSPPQPQKRSAGPKPPARAPGSGRPTKKERRQIDAWTGLDQA